MPRQIAPKLASHDCRERLYGRLPANVKAGLRAIARKEGKSMSWVVEEVVIDYFGMKTPRYIHRWVPRRSHRRVA